MKALLHIICSFSSDSWSPESWPRVSTYIFPVILKPTNQIELSGLASFKTKGILEGGLFIIILFKGFSEESKNLLEGD